MPGSVAAGRLFARMSRYDLALAGTRRQRNLVVSNPAAAGGIVYAASDDGKLRALATAK